MWTVAYMACAICNHEWADTWPSESGVTELPCPECGYVNAVRYEASDE